MKKDFKSESTISIIVATILIAIASIFWAFEHKVTFLVLTLMGVIALITAIYFHYAKPAPPTPRIDEAPDPFGRGQGE